MLMHIKHGIGSEIRIEKQQQQQQQKRILYP